MKNAQPGATRVRKKAKLADGGWDVDYHDEGIYLHSDNETPKHLALKAMLALLLRKKGRSFDTEARLEDKGRVDVLDWGPIDGKAVAYEVESGLTEQRKQEKIEQYVGGEVRDVIVIPVQDAPEAPKEMLDWLETYVS